MLENASAVEYREHQLQELCPVRPSVPKRSPPPSKTKPIGDPAGLSFYTARRRVGTRLGGPLLELASRASERMPKQMLRELLAAASAAGATRRHLLDADRLIDLAAALSEEEQLEAIALYRETARSDTLRSELLALLAWPGLSELAPPLRRQLLRYAIGPRPGALAHPLHEVDLRAFWARRTAETLRFLESGGRELQDFLVQPIRPVHLLRTPADLDLLILVF